MWRSARGLGWGTCPLMAVCMRVGRLSITNKIAACRKRRLMENTRGVAVPPPEAPTCGARSAIFATGGRRVRTPALSTPAKNGGCFRLATQAPASCMCMAMCRHPAARSCRPAVLIRPRRQRRRSGARRAVQPPSERTQRTLASAPWMGHSPFTVRPSCHRRPSLP